MKIARSSSRPAKLSIWHIDAKEETGSGHTLLLWDSEAPPPKGPWRTVLWAGFAKETAEDTLSLPQLVEENAEALRKRYLEWIYELGQTHLGSIRLVDRLQLRPGFSYWWMTLLVEKNYANSKRIYDAFRLMALEDLIDSIQPGRMALASSDRTLATVCRLWCGNVGRSFEWRRLKSQNRELSFTRRFYNGMPHPIRAFVTIMRYLWKRWPLRQKAEASGTRITFVDYLVHLGPKINSTGEFASNYWTDLPEVLNRAALKTNWLHHFVECEDVPSAPKARSLMDRFRDNAKGGQLHACFGGALDIPVVLAALRDYVRLVFRAPGIRAAKRHFSAAGSKLDLWPLFKQEWCDSIFGASAVLNCMFLNLFETTLEKMPYQEIGVYLQENQSWEMAFVHAWKTSGHGTLIGVPHTTVRYWDLRYFYDPRNYERPGLNDLPMPDRVAVNGPVPWAAYQGGGYPEDQLIEVEALRYLYLKEWPVAVPYREGALHILICGDYLPEVSHQMMEWLETASKSLPSDSRYVVKPHPACTIRADDYPSIKLEITVAPLRELLVACDVVFTSNVTSAAVDAYLAGLHVISVLDVNSFNLSPLRGLSSVVYVTGPNELALALQHDKRKDIPTAKPYFCLDSGLPRWRKLLSIEP